MHTLTEMKRSIQNSIQSALHDAGFKGKGPTWSRHGMETIDVVNLQKSNFGKQFYINLGIFIRSLGPELSPKENQCHLRVRLCSLAGETLKRALDLEDNEISPEQRDTAVRDAVQRVALTFFDSLRSAGDIRTKYSDGLLRGVAMQGGPALAAILGIA